MMKESDQERICPYCGTDLEKSLWNSEAHLEMHYKTADCQCGKKLRRRIGFITHKDPSIKKEESIDGVIRTIIPKEIKKAK